MECVLYGEWCMVYPMQYFVSRMQCMVHSTSYVVCTISRQRSLSKARPCKAEADSCWTSSNTKALRSCWRYVGSRRTTPSWGSLASIAASKYTYAQGDIFSRHRTAKKMRLVGHRSKTDTEPLVETLREGDGA